MRVADAMDPRYRALIVLGAYAGLRIGEMLGLRAQHVDLLHGRVNVAEILVEVSGDLYFGPPKTRAGRRAVPLPRVAIDAVNAHLNTYPAARTDLVFTAPERRTRPPRELAPSLREAGRRRGRARAAAPARSPAHRRRALENERSCTRRIIRHRSRSLCLKEGSSAGATPREIASRAGHTSVVTVLDRYGHLFPDAEERVNAALDRLAASATPSAPALVQPLAEYGS